MLASSAVVFTLAHASTSNQKHLGPASTTLRASPRSRRGTHNSRGPARLGHHAPDIRTESTPNPPRSPADAGRLAASEQGTASCRMARHLEESRAPDNGAQSQLGSVRPRILRAGQPKSGEPLFPNLMSPADARLGGVFMASASFRLPVALLKAVELSASPFEDGEVRLLKREPDWNRNAISGLFDGLRKLRCCVGGPLGPCASQPRRAVWYGTKPVSRSSSSAARSSSNPGPTAPACGSSAPSSDG